MTIIPDGYGIIAGRGKENAQAALAAALAAKVDPTRVLTVREGYLVPDAVIAAFHAAKDAENVESSDAKPLTAAQKKKAKAAAAQAESESEAAEESEAEAEAPNEEKDE